MFATIFTMASIGIGLFSNNFLYTYYIQKRKLKIKKKNKITSTNIIFQLGIKYKIR